MRIGRTFLLAASIVAILTTSASAQIYDFATIAGLAADPGSADGTNNEARFCNPRGVTVDTNGNLYVTDFVNSTIRKITPARTNWVTTTIAGLAWHSDSADGTNSNARFDQPAGIAIDGSGNLYVADLGNHIIRKVTPVGTNWVTTTIAGSAGNHGSADGTNSDARFYYPSGVTADTNGNLYVADEFNATIRKVTPVGTNWVTTTIAGAGIFGAADGTNSDALFYEPVGIAVDGSGNLYVADLHNDTIRKIARVGTNWVTSTLAGSAGNDGSADGTNSNARFYWPFGITADGSGSLYVADLHNDTIRKIVPVGTNWVVSTIGGLAEDPGTANGTNSDARFYNPSGVAVDGSGNLYVADTGNDTIRLGVPLTLTPPVIDSIAISNVFATVGSNTIVVAGDSLGFTVTAHPTYSLSYLWDFGDGSSSAWSLLNTATHTYSTSNNCGLYTVTATVSNAAGAGISNLPVTVACQLSVRKLHANVNFNPAKSNADSCALTGTLTLDTGFSVTNKAVTVDIGGAQVSFVLDAKGRGPSPPNTCKLSYKKKTGPWTFTATLKNGSWATQWASYGLTNATVKASSVTLPAVLVISDETFAGEKILLYKATANKSGSAK